MKLTLQEICQITGCSIKDNQDFTVTGLSFINDAKEGDLVLAGDESYFKKAAASQASVILTDRVYSETDKIIIISENPNESYNKILNKIFEPNIYHSYSCPIAPGCNIADNVKIGYNSVIGENTAIGENTVIHPNVYIGANCKIGANCIIYPNTSVYDRSIIGNHVIIHSGTVIGADGFGYQPSASGLEKVPQTGYVEISDEVEIGANSCIDRAKIGKTFIGYSAKIDNLCQIAHNCHIGNFTIICGQAGIAGSCTIGDQCLIGAQAGFADHVSVGDKCIFAAKTGVSKNYPSGSVIMGYPSHPVSLARRIEALKGRLPETHQEFRDMKKKLEKLQEEVISIKKKI